MVDREKGRQIDVRPAELLEGKLVVAVLFPFDERIQLPLHQLCRNPFGLAHPRRVERPKLGEPFLREQHPVVSRGGCVRRKLFFESILLFAREIPRRGRLVRVGAHPLGGEIAEEVRDRSRRPRRFTLRRQAHDNDADDNNDRKRFHG